MFDNVNIDELRNAISFYEEQLRINNETLAKHDESLKEIEKQRIQINTDIYKLSIGYLKEIEKYVENKK